MKKQSRKINYKQTSLSSGVTVAPVSVAHVAPTAPTAPTALTNGQTAAAPRAQTFLRLLEMSQKKISRQIDLLNTDSRGLKSKRSSRKVKNIMYVCSRSRKYVFLDFKTVLFSKKNSVVFTVFIIVRISCLKEKLGLIAGKNKSDL